MSHTCSYPGGDICVECLVQDEESEHRENEWEAASLPRTLDEAKREGPFEHKHRWLVEVGNVTLTETCRCGEKRIRAKTVQEHVGSGDIFKQPSIPRTHNHDHYHGNNG